jgi:S1-C subfamily serine protease
VDSTLSGSPSAKAGLVQGDVITGLDGKTVGSANDLTNLLQSHHPGDSVQLTWTDSSGQSQSASVTLTTGPPA